MFLIWQTWSPAASHGQFIDASIGIPIFFSGYALLLIAMRWWSNRLARGMMKGNIGRAVDRFNLGMTCARALIPAWFAAGVFCLGWKPTVEKLLGSIQTWPVITPGTVVGLIPGFTAWMGLWWSQFPVDRALREHSVLFQLEADLPVFAPPTFGDYFVNKLRVQLLFTIVPVLLILTLRDLAVLALAAISHTARGQQWGLRLPLSDSGESVVSFCAVAVVLIFSPLLLRHVLHTQQLPESQLRRSLSAICKQAKVSCRDILLWRTQNNMGNAAVMGLIPQVRYVMLSDLLLESMTDQQIQAVFAHELGHVKHRHLAWFVAFFLTVSSCLFSLAGMLEEHLPLGENAREAYDIYSSLICGALLILGYGFLSRWFERQADVYAARSLTLADAESGNAPAFEEFGSSIFASALERVAVVNNIPVAARNWTHGSIRSRMLYIRSLGRDPEVAAQFDRTGRRVLVGLILLIAVCGAIGIYGELRG